MSTDEKDPPVFTEHAPRILPPDPSAFDPSTDEERLLATLFLEEPNLQVLSEKLAAFTTVIPLANYRTKEGPLLQLARRMEGMLSELAEKDAEIARLNLRIEEYESGEEVKRLKANWSEWEIEAGKAHAVLTSIINALTYDASLNPPEYVSHTFTADKAVFESIEREHSDFPYFFDRLFKRNRG